MYSQALALGAGASATWDSTDITTNLGGDIDDNVMVTVRNYSTDAPAIGTAVHVDISDFGIGFARESLGTHAVNLARSGFVGSEVEIPFFVPASIRHERDLLSVFVSISHPHDRDALNNEGLQAWSASRARSGNDLSFSFQVRNRLTGHAAFTLQLVENDLPATLSHGSVSLFPGQVESVELRVAGAHSVAGRHRFSIAASTADGSLYGGVFHRFDVWRG